MSKGTSQSLINSQSKQISFVVKITVKFLTLKICACFIGDVPMHSLCVALFRDGDEVTARWRAALRKSGESIVEMEMFI